MEIQVQYADGSISHFAMKDERSYLELIESIRPSELFNQQLLRIQTGNQTSIINMKAIESIYFPTTTKVRTLGHPSARDFGFIPEKEYLEKMEILRGKYALSENIFEPGNSVSTLGTVHCASGKILYLQVEIIAKLRVEQLMDLHKLLERMPGVIPCSPEGYIAINPANVKRIEIYPAPKETARSAWLVD